MTSAGAINEKQNTGADSAASTVIGAMDFAVLDPDIEPGRHARLPARPTAGLTRTVPHLDRSTHGGGGFFNTAMNMASPEPSFPPLFYIMPVGPRHQGATGFAENSWSWRQPDRGRRTSRTPFWRLPNGPGARRLVENSLFVFKMILVP